MTGCNADTLILAAKNSLKILESKTELTDVNYDKFKEDRDNSLKKIEQCHADKMTAIGKSVDTHATNAANTDIHSFEKIIAERLVVENELKYKEQEAIDKEINYKTLLEENYKLDSKIKEYEKKTNKINENMSSNNLLLRSQTTKTNLLKNTNLGVLIFVICSLVYINFKQFFTIKSKTLSKKKENTLFNQKDDKKQYETINNETKMTQQKELLSN
jgi:hypothetical protein